MLNIAVAVARVSQIRNLCPRHFMLPVVASIPLVSSIEVTQCSSTTWLLVLLALVLTWFVLLDWVGSVTCDC